MIGVLVTIGIVAASLGLAYAFNTGAHRGYLLHGRLRELQAQVDDMRRRKDEAYVERTLVLTLFASVLQDSGETSDSLTDVHKWRLFRGYDAHFKGWGNALYIEGPEQTGLGQMCWHFPDSHAYLLDCLGVPAHPKGWDGTTTEQKYERIRRYATGSNDEVGISLG